MSGYFRPSLAARSWSSSTTASWFPWTVMPRPPTRWPMPKPLISMRCRCCNKPLDSSRALLRRQPATLHVAKDSVTLRVGRLKLRSSAERRIGHACSWIVLHRSTGRLPTAWQSGIKTTSDLPDPNARQALPALITQISIRKGKTTALPLSIH
jgi:hypothetical protein